MSKPRPFPEGSLPKLQAALKRARTKGDFQRAQCLWLREALGLSCLDIAKAIGWKKDSVLRVQADYINRGEAALQPRPGRGGRRREVLSKHQEHAVLREVRDASWPDGVVDTRAVHEAVEKAAGHRVPASTVYRMLARHGWHKFPRAVIAKSGIAPPSAQTPAPPQDRAGDENASVSATNP